MRHPIVIPELGATGGDVRIVSWAVREGQTVKEGETLFTVETDKAVTEIPAFRGGALVSISVAAGQNCAPGAVVAYLLMKPKPTAADRLLQTPSARKAHIKLRAEAPPSDALGPTVEPLVQAFSTMTLIRLYEEHLYRLFLQGLVPGTLHQCQGQEAVAVGVCTTLRADDLIYSTHRPVGHLIAKGASLDAMTAEIWGKATGCVGGKGGQMHLADFSVGAMVSNAIVGANITIAVGSALAFRMLGLDRVAVSFFGDGASNIGAFHEGLNLAAVKRAPAIFVCENNLYAASTHISHAMNIRDIADRAAAYGMPGAVVDGMDVEAVTRSRPRRSLGRDAATVLRLLSARLIAFAAIRAAIPAATAAPRNIRPGSSATRSNAQGRSSSSGSARSRLAWPPSSSVRKSGSKPPSPSRSQARNQSHQDGLALCTDFSQRFPIEQKPQARGRKSRCGCGEFGLRAHCCEAARAN